MEELDWDLSIKFKFLREEIAKYEKDKMEEMNNN